MKDVKIDKTVRKSLAQCSFSSLGEPSAVDVKDGKILRIRPYHYDTNYTKEEISPWRIEKDGKILELQMKTQISPHNITYKKRVYLLKLLNKATDFFLSTKIHSFIYFILIYWLGHAYTVSGKY